VRLAFIKLPDWHVILRLIDACDGITSAREAHIVEAVEDKPLGAGHALKAYNLKTNSRCRSAVDPLQEQRAVIIEATVSGRVLSVLAWMRNARHEDCCAPGPTWV